MDRAKFSPVCLLFSQQQKGKHVSLYLDTNSKAETESVYMGNKSACISMNKELFRDGLQLSKKLLSFTLPDLSLETPWNGSNDLTSAAF